MLQSNYSRSETRSHNSQHVCSTGFREDMQADLCGLQRPSSTAAAWLWPFSQFVTARKHDEAYTLKDVNRLCYTDKPVILGLHTNKLVCVTKACNLRPTCVCVCALTHVYMGKDTTRLSPASSIRVSVCMTQSGLESSMSSVTTKLNFRD